MRIQFKSSIIVLCLTLALALLFQGCMKPGIPSGNQNPPGNSITHLIESINNSTLYDSLIHKTGLDTTLNLAGPFTVFIATDTALELAGLNAAVISNTPDSILYRLATYSIIYGVALGAANLPSGPDAKVVTAGGDSIFISNSYYGIFINGIPVTESDVDASNGIINSIQHPLIPPVGTLMQTLQLDTAYSFMAAAITRASQGTNDLVDKISSSPFTLFVPVNSSFQALGYNTVNDINNADPDSLAKIISYHIVPQRVFTSDFTLINQPLTLNGSSLQIVQGMNPTVRGTSNSTGATLVNSNVMASNGVIHLISEVLLP
jgi:uncharacterized surface protein with fasciclin (FAS1) repeats